MLDLILPKPVFKWNDPTLVPRFCHKFEFFDQDPAKLKQNTPEILIQNVIQRQKFSDGKIRSKNFENLIKVVRGNGLVRNRALFQRILSQRGSVPIMFESADSSSPGTVDSYVKCLEFFDIRVGNDSICLATDTSLPRIAFISDRGKRERNPKRGFQHETFNYYDEIQQLLFWRPF